MLVLTQSFNPSGSQVSRGTDFVHPMIPFLLATALSCSESQDLIEKMRKNPRNGPEVKAELISVVKDSTEKGCWDAND